MRPVNSNRIGFAVLGLWGTLCGGLPAIAVAAPEYNTGFLRHGSSPEVVESVNAGDSLMPGVYEFRVFVNGDFTAKFSLPFKRVAGDDNNVLPCFTLRQIRVLGFEINDRMASDLASGCHPMESFTPNAKMTVEAGYQRLTIVAPQADLIQTPRGFVNHTLWDEGVPVALLSYDLTGDHDEYVHGRDTDYFYGNLKGGVNWGAWRYRNQSTVSHGDLGGGTDFDSVTNTVTRDIEPIRSRLTLGDAYTGDMVFDPVRFRGVRMQSDQSQLPYSRRGYAPVIRGVANSDARVEVKQNGYTIYSTRVSAGPFVLRDVSPTSNSGDLTVVVREADGTTHSFQQAYSAVPSMVRPGMWRYSSTIGEYRSGSDDNHFHPVFGQLSIGRGFSHGFTALGGVLASEHYDAFNLGVSQGLGSWGAASVDVTYANTRLSYGETKNGASVRFLYSKALDVTGTNISFIGQRYSSEGFFGFQESIEERDYNQGLAYRYPYLDNNIPDSQGVPDWVDARERYASSREYYNSRSQWQVNINQSLHDLGQVYVNLSDRSYWHTSEHSRTWQAGYNGHFGQITFGAYFSSSKSRFTETEHQVGVNLSLPLGSVGKHQISSNSSYTHSNLNGNSYYTGVSGSLLADNRLSYNAQVGHTDAANNTFNAHTTYRGGKGTITAGTSYTNDYQTYSAELAGSIVAHRGGVTLGQQLNGTAAIVHAEGAKGVPLENHAGVTVDRFGYAVVDGLTPYQRNRVALNANDIPSGLDVPDPTLTLVPTRDAFVMADFQTHAGRSLLLRLTGDQAADIPIGATVYDDEGSRRGVVGSDQTAFVSGVSSEGRLVARWGEDNKKVCHIDLPKLGPAPKDHGYKTINIGCVKR